MHTSRIARRVVVVATAVVVALAWAAPAWAHTTVTPEQSPPGFTYLRFRIGHGCDGAATETLRVQIPEGVASVTPEMVAGWEAETDEGELDEPVEMHGEEVTEGVTEVRWTGGELPDDRTKEFGLSVFFAGEPGETVEFPAIQECVDGSELAWIQSPGEDETRDDLEEPAPAVTLVEEEGEEGADSALLGIVPGVTPMAAALGALVVGLVALVVGVAALVRAGRRA